jgi:hypothetical protein
MVDSEKIVNDHSYTVQIFKRCNVKTMSIIQLESTTRLIKQ